MIELVFSTQHKIVPTAVVGILIVLLLAIIITEGIARVKKGEGFFKKPKRFFKEGADLKKVFGTLILFIGYTFCLDIFGFTVTSIVFVFLFNLLYAEFSKKSVINSIIISLVSTLIVSIFFGVVFRITLPNGMFSVTFADFGFTIY